uniref:FCS-Like Zinc finger 5-like n=1 Tax=Erigeron canadensis TaxID=72917 RepID=UPI001CB9D5F1|nr:FCS-Like Zinc finger 5-like [Erigeron canadensis]
MLLGKRQRPPMKRTTSMTEFSFDLNHTTPAVVHHPAAVVDPPSPTVVVPKIHRRSSADFNQTSNFLKACHLCKRSLITGRDIFMYRGDSAFCSLECRQQQMNQDEKKDKCSMLSNTPIIATTSPNASETVAAM